MRFAILILFSSIFHSIFAQDQLSTMIVSESTEVFEKIPIFETEAYLKILSSNKMEGRASGTEGYLNAAKYVSNVLRSYGIGSFYEDGYLTKTRIDEKFSPNVIGFIGNPGSKNVIVLGAHLDHVGKNKNQIYNGANDNASGVVTLLGISKFLKNYIKNDDVFIIIAFFTAEELGKFGSFHFASQLKAMDLSPQYMLNFEMLGRSISKKNNEKVYLVGHKKTSLDELLNEKSNSDWVLTLSDEVDQNLYKRSDNHSFDVVFENCPAVTFITYNLRNYPHYHMTSDNYNKIDTKNLNILTNRLAKSIHYIIENNIDISP